MNQGESQLHPTLKDSDGGAMIVGRGDEHYGRGRALHAGMTASERIHYGHATAADLAMLEQMRQDTIRWQQSPEGRAWLAANNLKGLTP